MRSDTVFIDNQGNGFEEALNQTRKVAAYEELGEKNSLQLQLMTEEMLSLARSVTGELQAKFWLECEEQKYVLHMSTKTIMDNDKRYKLISSTTSNRNEAAKGFLGKLRDAFEQAMVMDTDFSRFDAPVDIMVTMPQIVYHESPEWDGYERSILQRIADNVKIGIRGGTVDMSVTKDFAARKKNV